MQISIGRRGGIGMLVAGGLILAAHDAVLAQVPGTGDALPVVTLRVTDAYAAEAGTNTGAFMVSQSGATADLTVYYTLGGTASNGVDHEYLPGAVTIPAGSTSAVVVVTPIDDTLAEPTEYLSVSLKSAIAYQVASPSYGSINIEDNDNHPPTVQITAPADGSVFNGPTDLTIEAAASDSDGQVVRVEFSAGTRALGVVSNPPYRVVWTNVPAGSNTLTARAIDNLGASTVSAPVGIVVKFPVVTLRVTDAYAAEAGTNTGAFMVSQSGATADLTVYYTLGGTASNGVDYEYLPGAVTIPAGSTSAVVVVTPIDDTLAEPTEYLSVSLKSAIAYQVASPSYGSINIEDNDNHPPTVQITAPADGSVFNGPTDLTIEAAASDSDGQVVRVEFSAGNRALGVVSNPPYRVVWTNVPAGSNTLTARAIDNLGASTVSAPVGIVVKFPVVTLRVTDAYAAEAGTNTGAFMVSQSGATADLTVNYTLSGTASNGVDYEYLPGAVTIPAGSTSAVVVVTPIDDTLVEPTEYVSVSLKSSLSYQLLASSYGTISIQDNDNHPPTVQITAPADGSVFTGPTDLTIEAAASDSDGQVVRVEFSAGSRALGVVSNLPYRVVWTNVPAGSNTLTARAVDNLGASTVSAPVGIVVKFPVVTLRVTDAYAAEAGTNTGAFMVSQSGATADLTVYYTLGGTASNGVDYEYLPGAVTIPAGSTSAVVVVTPIDDTLAEPTEYLSVSLKSAIAYQVGSPSYGSINIEDNDNHPPTVQITAPADGSVFNGPTDLTIEAAASDSDGQVVRVEFSAGTRALGVVSNPPYRVVWTNVPAGSNTLTARAIDNLGASTVSAPVGIVVKFPVVTLRVTDAYAAEAGTNTGAFMVSQSGATADLTVYYTLGGTASNGVDYEYLPGAVTIPAGSTSAVVVVTPIDDTLAEPTEYLSVSLKSAIAYQVASPSYGSINIEDNDNHPPTVQITAPADGSVFNGPTDLTIEAAASDSDGQVVRVEFSAGTRALGVVSNPPYRVVWTNVPAGSNTLTARAIDNLGASTVSAPVGIVVKFPVVTLRVTDAYAAEAGTNTGAFMVSQSGATADLTVYYTLGGTASNGVDYEYLPGAVTIPAGSTSAVVVVTPIDDTLAEPTEYLSVSLKSAIAYQVGSPSYGSINIEDNDNHPPTVQITAPADGSVFNGPTDLTIEAAASDSDGQVVRVEFSAGTRALGVVSNPPYRVVWTNVPAGSNTLTARAIDNLGASTVSAPVGIVVKFPVVTLRVTDAYAAEAGTNTGAFMVSQSGATADLTVYYTLGGTASNGVDYEYLPGAVTIPAGSTSAVVVVTPIDDTLAEPTEYLSVSLKSAIAYQVGSPSYGSINIEDNDNHPPTVQITAPADGSVFNGPTDLTIEAAASDSDGQVVRVEFSAGTRALGVVSNPPYRVVWTNVPAGSNTLTARAIDNLGASTVSAPVGIVVKFPVVTLRVTDAYAAEAGTNTGAFMVSQSGATADLTVYYTLGGTASNGVDYEYLPGAVTIPAGSTSAVVVVTPIDDTLAEPTEYLSVSLKSAIAYQVASPSYGSINIEDNDNHPPTVQITTPTNGSVFVGPTDILVTAEAADSDGAVVRVEFTATGGTAGSSGNQSWSGTDTNQPFSVLWTNAYPGTYRLSARAVDNVGAVGEASPVYVTVKPAPGFPVVSLQVTDSHAAEPGTDTGAFTVSQSGATGAVTVSYMLGGTASNGVDYAPLTGMVTIPEGATSTVVVVAPLDDALLEPTEYVSVWLKASPSYQIVYPSGGTIYILDNDGPVAITPVNIAPRAALLADPALENPTPMVAVADAGRNQGSAVVIQWQSSPDTTYTIYSCTDLRNGFSVLQENILATPPLNTYIDTANPSGTAFYMIRAN